MKISNESDLFSSYLKLVHLMKTVRRHSAQKTFSVQELLKNSHILRGDQILFVIDNVPTVSKYIIDRFALHACVIASFYLLISVLMHYLL